MLTPQQVAEKWRANTANAGTAFAAGVNGVTVAPGQRAAAQLQTYIQGVQAGAQRWATNVAAVSLESWKAAMLQKGSARIAGGVTAAVPKVVEFLTRWLPYEQQLKDRVASMPRGSLSDSQARANFAIAYNASFSKRLHGS